MEQKKKKGLRIRSCLTGAIWLALVFSTVISALLFAFLNHFFNLPGSIPVLGWLLDVYKRQDFVLSAGKIQVLNVYRLSCKIYI